MQPVVWGDFIWLFDMFLNELPCRRNGQSCFTGKLECVVTFNLPRDHSIMMKHAFLAELLIRKNNRYHNRKHVENLFGSLLKLRILTEFNL